MEINNLDKAKFLEKQNIKYDVHRGSDVLQTSKIKVHDIYSNQVKNDKKINKMSDIFPQTQQDDENLLG